MVLYSNCATAASSAEKSPRIRLSQSICVLLRTQRSRTRLSRTRMQFLPKMYQS